MHFLTTMVLTKAQKREIVQHILEHVFGQEPNSKLHAVFDEHDIQSPHDIIAMSEEDFETLGYTNDKDQYISLPKGNIGLLKAFHTYFLFCQSNGNPIDDSQGWMSITAENFDQFRISSDFVTQTTGPDPYRQARGASGSTTSSIVNGSESLREFRCGIKRDPTLFVSLKDDGAWDAWYRSTLAQARAQGVDDVLDHTYTPKTQDEISVFQEKQKYMYAVFDAKLLTDKGKALVRTYQRKYDAQQVFRELCDYALKSTKASMDASSMLEYLTTMRLGDGKWKGSTHAFILHWQDQVRKYHTLAPNQKLPTDLQRTMLENAVHPIDALCAIKIQADQHKVHTGAALDYSQYTTLLLSAAQQHDKLLMQSTARPRRRVYDHEIVSNEESEDVYEAYSHYTIDSPIPTISAFASSSMPMGPTRLTRDQWHRLTDTAKTTWDQLSDDAKAIILAPRPPQGPRVMPHGPTSRRQVNAHDIAHLMDCLAVNEPPDPQPLMTYLHAQSEGSLPSSSNAVSSSDVTSMPEDAMPTADGEQDQQLLAHITKHKTLPPGNLKHLLSPNANQKGQRYSTQRSDSQWCDIQTS